jgi:hypothetical protein
MVKPKQYFIILELFGVEDISTFIYRVKLIGYEYNEQEQTYPK